MVYVSTQCKASLCSVLHCPLSWFLSWRSVHFAFTNAGGFASCVDQPLFRRFYQLSRSLCQLFIDDSLSYSNLPFDFASIHSIGAESPTIPWQQVFHLCRVNEFQGTLSKHLQWYKVSFIDYSQQFGSIQNTILHRSIHLYYLCFVLGSAWRLGFVLLCFSMIGLLRIHQDRTLLRAKCLISSPVAYYFAIVNNTILRFAWILKLFIVFVFNDFEV